MMMLGRLPRDEVRACWGLILDTDVWRLFGSTAGMAWVVHGIFLDLTGTFTILKRHENVLPLLQLVSRVCAFIISNSPSCPSTCRKSDAYKIPRELLSSQLSSDHSQTRGRSPSPKLVPRIGDHLKAPTLPPVSQASIPPSSQTPPHSSQQSSSSHSPTKQPQKLAYIPSQQTQHPNQEAKRQKKKNKKKKNKKKKHN